MKGSGRRRYTISPRRTAFGIRYGASIMRGNWWMTFGRVPCAYVADGHHRTASAVRVGKERRAANPHHTGNEEYNWFLAVLFPGSQLSILPYNRCVLDLNGRTGEGLIAGLKGAGFQSRMRRTRPRRGPGEVRMYLGGKWRRVAWTPDAAG